MTVLLLDIWVPGVVESPNALWRRHHMDRHKRVRAVVMQVRQITTYHLLLRGGPTPLPPLAVDFCLVRRRLFDAGDDLAYALKAHRDGLIRALGTHDGRTSGNTFRYHQRLAQGCCPEGVAITVREEEP